MLSHRGQGPRHPYAARLARLRHAAAQAGKFHLTCKRTRPGAWDSAMSCCMCLGGSTCLDKCRVLASGVGSLAGAIGALCAGSLRSGRLFCSTACSMSAKDTFATDTQLVCTSILSELLLLLLLTCAVCIALM